MPFLIASVPSTKVSDDGQTITLRLQDAQGAQLDLEARYTALEDLSDALVEASARAHRARRARSAADETAPPGAIEPFLLKAYRFSVADDGSAMHLRLVTSIGPTDIALPADRAVEFVAEATQHLEMLNAPRQMN